MQVNIILPVLFLDKLIIAYY